MILGVSPDHRRRGHLSVFDRPQTPSDDLEQVLGPHLLLDGRAGERLDLSTLRLAVIDRGCHAYVALGLADDIYLITHDEPGGGGAAVGALLSVLEERGVVCLLRSSNAGGSYVTGIVGDEVVAVFVGGQPAPLANNVFLGDSTSIDESIVLRTDTETREVSLKPPPSEPSREEQVELPRYLGQIECGPGRRLTVEIDDVDSPAWRAVPRKMVIAANTPPTSMVDVRLLDGPRAGEHAPAEMVFARDVEPAVVFLGKEPFGRTDPS
jgi:hypothetical protein